MGPSRTFSLSALVASAAIAMLTTGCHSTPPPKPLDQLTPTEHAGYVVFRQDCGMCHYDRQDGPLQGPSLLGIYKKPYLPSGAPANDDRVSNTILHGRNHMPPFAGRISDDELTDLLAYLHTL